MGRDPRAQPARNAEADRRIRLEQFVVALCLHRQATRMLNGESPVIDGRIDRVAVQFRSMLTIGQLARRVGMRPSAIRYYEAQGVLLPPTRSASQYRLYGTDAVSVLHFVQRARELGFSLEQIRQLIAASVADPPCTACRPLIEQHLAQVEEELRQLRKLRDRLKRLARQPTPSNSDAAICPLIEATAC